MIFEYGNKNYIEEVKKKFGKYQTLSIIEQFNKLIAQYDFSFSRPLQLFLELEENLTFDDKKEHPFLSNYNDTKVVSLLKAVKTFAQEIEFEKFYNSQKDRFNLYINCVSEQLLNNNIPPFLENYYGIRCNKEFIVNLIPWRTYGCYGTQNKTSIYTHLCCHHTSKNDLNVYPKDSFIFNYASFLFHEFSHSIINPIVDKYASFLEEQENFTNFSQLQKVGYGSNTSILKDYLVRAATQRYLYLTNNDYFEIQRKEDFLFGFEEIDEFIALLKNYEQNKEKYIRFENYFEQVFIPNLKKQKII